MPHAPLLRHSGYSQRSDCSDLMQTTFRIVYSAREDERLAIAVCRYSVIIRHVEQSSRELRSLTGRHANLEKIIEMRGKMKTPGRIATGREDGGLARFV